jgi:hypothetical protein
MMRTARMATIETLETGGGADGAGSSACFRLNHCHARTQRASSASRAAAGPQKGRRRRQRRTHLGVANGGHRQHEGDAETNPHLCPHSALCPRPLRSGWHRQGCLGFTSLLSPISPSWGEQKPAACKGARLHVHAKSPQPFLFHRSQQQTPSNSHWHPPRKPYVRNPPAPWVIEQTPRKNWLHNFAV